MADKARPVLLTALLSGAAVLGYVCVTAYSSARRPAAGAADAPVGEDPAASDEHDDAPAPLADKLPEFSLDTLGGTPQSIRSWPGKPLLINFWATWCGPCLREIPMLKQLQTRRTGPPGRRHRGRQARRGGQLRRDHAVQLSDPDRRKRRLGRGRRVRRQRLRVAFHGIHGSGRQPCSASIRASCTRSTSRTSPRCSMT